MNKSLSLLIAIIGITMVNIQSTSLISEETYIEIKEYTGKASWYDYSLKDSPRHSKITATCASRTLKRYSSTKVTNIANGKSVICFVNDYVENPLVELDLSSYAFSQIADLKTGIINIKIENYVRN